SASSGQSIDSSEKTPKLENTESMDTKPSIALESQACSVESKVQPEIVCNQFNCMDSMPCDANSCQMFSDEQAALAIEQKRNSISLNDNNCQQQMMNCQSMMNCSSMSSASNGMTNIAPGSNGMSSSNASSL